MKAKDEKGRFKKENEDAEFTIRIPSIKRIIFYMNLLIIFLLFDFWPDAKQV